MAHLLQSEIYKKVRLKPENLDVIVTAFNNNFKQGDSLWIFGSRVDLTARGGDIDLYIETSETDPDLLYDKKIKFTLEIWKGIGEQKIDVVLRLIKNDFELPIYNVALENGIKLV